MRYLYLAIAVLGAIAPYFFVGRFMMSTGGGFSEFLAAAVVNDAATTATADVLVASLAFWFFLFVEARKWDIRYWGLFVVANLGVGLSFALPLFLYFRQVRVEQRSREEAEG